MHHISVSTPTIPGKKKKGYLKMPRIKYETGKILTCRNYFFKSLRTHLQTSYNTAKVWLQPPCCWGWVQFLPALITGLTVACYVWRRGIAKICSRHCLCTNSYSSSSYRFLLWSTVSKRHVQKEILALGKKNQPKQFVMSEMLLGRQILKWQLLVLHVFRENTQSSTKN